MAKHEFKKGHERKGGRKKGTPNKFTSTIKEAVMLAFQQLQNDPKANLLEWGRKNPKDFYQIAAKLIPTEITGSIEQTIIKVERE